MDPNANIQEQERISIRNTGGTFAPQHGDRDRLWELREALAEWLDNGGFEPDWATCPHTAAVYGKGAK